MKILKKKIEVKVEKTDTGFSAFALDWDVYTTGKTISELQKNMTDALNFYFEDEGYQVTSKTLVMEIDLKQFFQYYRVINSKYLAERIGMNQALLSQYVQGKKKPSLRQTHKILEGIHEIGKELSELNLVIHD